VEPLPDLVDDGLGQVLVVDVLLVVEILGEILE
jgi:hypothetical protein